MLLEDYGIDIQEVVEQELEGRISGANVLIWPFPNKQGDQFFPEITEVKEIDTVYTAVGKAGSNLRVFQDSYDEVQCLDYLYEESVLSSDIPEMVDQGTLPDIDVEYARDIAMDLKYNKGRKVEDIVEDSYSILSDQGIVVYDLHDFGPIGLYTHPEIQMDIEQKESSTALEKLNESKTRHVEMVRESLENVFPRVEVYSSGTTLKDSYLLASKT